jgi:hypothetical protein
MRRYKIGKCYVVRRKDGTFQRWVSIGSSNRADRRVIARRKVKSGYGHRGDLKR